MDDATNNDTALVAIAARIPSLEVKESPLRCFGYIVNLVVKAMLYGDLSLQSQLDNCGEHRVVNNQSNPI
jgi:hypothetical protein